MISWIILIIGVAAILAITKLTHFKHKFYVISLIILFLFLAITFVKVAGGNSVDIKSPSGFFSGVKLYFSWLGHVFDNIRVITGNAIRMEWFGHTAG